MWSFKRHAYYGSVALALIVFVLSPAPVQTVFDATPVARDTFNLGHGGGTTGTMNTTGANLLVACVSSHGSVPPPSLTDSGTNSWILAASSLAFNDGWIQLFYSVPTSVGPGHSFTVEGAGVMASISVMAWAGAHASPFDKASGGGAAGTSVQPGLVEPIANDELLVTCITNTGGTNSGRTINENFGNIQAKGQSQDLPYSMSIASAYRVQTAAQPTNPTWSFSPSNTANAVIATFKTGTPPPTTLPRLYSTSVDYVGGFRVPYPCGSEDNHLGTGGEVIAYNPSGTLYVSTHTYLRHLVEISIPPEPVDSPTLSALPTANCISGVPVEPTEGRKTQGNLPNSQHMAEPTGMVVADGKLWINNGVYYDGGGTQQLSLLSRPLDLAISGQVKGLYGINPADPPGLPPITPSATSKGVALISSDWSGSDKLDGDLLLSKFATPVASGASYGPNAIVVKSASLNGPEQTSYELTAAATALFYPAAHNLAGDPEGPDTGALDRIYTTWSMAHGHASLVQPRGTSTLLVFQVAGGTRGPSAEGYGVGYGCGCEQPVTPRGGPVCPAKPDTPCAFGKYWHDPGKEGSGYHGYPYVYQVLAYDMNDLVAVKSGTKQPWQLRPYEGGIWELPFPIKPRNVVGGTAAGDHKLSNAAYDSVNNKIYIAQWDCCDLKPETTSGQTAFPIIHVFQVRP